MTTRPLRWCGFLLVLGVSPGLDSPAPHRARASEASQDQLLSAARSYASRYLANLPSFVCAQTIDQFQSDKKGRRWRKGDTLTSQLVWDHGHEQRTLQYVNNRPISDKTAWWSPLVSEGEFGNLLDSVLGDSSEAVFSWRGWDTISDKHVGVFAYRVDEQHSPMRLTVGSYQAVVPFQGLIYTDETNGTVWRITNDANSFPTEVATKSISRSVDYGEVAIGDTQYVLPVRAVILLDTGTRKIRNELRFESYRHFTADSRISFSPSEVNKSPQLDPDKR